MVAKAIGYVIGTLFALGLLAPLGLAVWFVYDRADVLLTTTTETATIERCHVIRTKKGTNYSSSWAPVAVTADGTKIKGSFGWKNKETCTSDIGETTSVFVHASDKDNNRINRFFQFWFYPLMYTTVSTVFYPLSYRAWKKKRSKT